MFPGCEIVQKFSLGKTKNRYTVLYGIFPEFKKSLIYDINKSPFYTISCDESFKSEMQMFQMDFGVRYWNEKKKTVEKRCYNSKFTRRRNAQSLFDNLQESMTDFGKNKLIQLAMDRPTVNWNVSDILDDNLIEENHSKTVHIGSCAQHIVHGALEEGILKSAFSSLYFRCLK